MNMFSISIIYETVSDCKKFNAIKSMFEQWAFSLTEILDLGETVYFQLIVPVYSPTRYTFPQISLN